MPIDTKTHLARLAKKKRAAPGNLADLLARQWRAVEAADAVLVDAAAANDSALVLKGVHALTQAAGAYARLVEAGEIEARLAEVEQRLEAEASASAAHGRPRAPRPRRVPSTRS